jgi:hypothetical protein
MIGLFLLFAFYFFQPRAFINGLHHALFWGTSWRGFVLPAVYKEVSVQIARACPALLFGFPLAIVAYAVWQRARYFGNTAPLLMALAFTVLAMAHPHLGGAGFLLAAIPFFFIFVAGIVADLMETRYRRLVTACTVGMLAAYGLWNVLELVRASRG